MNELAKAYSICGIVKHAAESVKNEKKRRGNKTYARGRRRTRASPSLFPLGSFCVVIASKFVSRRFVVGLFVVDDALQDDIGEEESGWKLVHGDVFRFPR